MSQLGNGIKQRLSLRAELEALVSDFDKASEALPPDEHLWQWTQRARDLHLRIASSNLPGRNKLLQRVREFRSYVWGVRADLRRYREQRQELDFPSTRESIWDETAALLPNQQRHKLSTAIAETWKQTEVREPTRPSPSQVPTTLHEAQPRIDTAGDSSFDLTINPALNALELDAVEDLQRQKKAESNTTVRREREQSEDVTQLTSVHSIRFDPITAIVGRLARPGTFSRAREIALAWLREKNFKLETPTPDNFELDGPYPGHRAVAVGLANVWAMQAETAEALGRGRKWRVELVLVDATPAPAVSITLTAISTADQPKPAPSVPLLVSKLIDEIGLLDIEAGEILSARPIPVETPDALQGMLKSLQSASRRRPAIVISKYHKDGQQSTLLDPDALAHKLRGIATVYVLSRNMSWGLTHELSKRFAVAGASTRLFRPSFTPDDAPSRHPIWTPSVLKEQGLNLRNLSALFEHEAAQMSLRALEQEDDVPPFEKIRERVLRRQLDQARRRAATAIAGDASESTRLSALQAALDEETKLRSLFEDDNVSQRQELLRLRRERDDLLLERDAWRAREFHLNSRINSLEDLQRRSVDGEAPPDFPNDWDELEDWCETNLGDSVFVTTKAIRAARNSDFENIPFCYEVLQFLADTYVPCRRGELDGGGAQLEIEKSRLGIDISPVGRAASARSTKDTYSASYKSKKVSLDMHAKGSNDRERRYGFRLYFHWFEDEQKVIVGWFPSHLVNDMT